MNALTIFELVKHIDKNVRLFGNPKVTIETFSSLNGVKDFSLVWIRKMHLDYLRVLSCAHDLVVILEPCENIHLPTHNCYLFVKNPHMVYFKLLEQLFATEENEIPFSNCSILKSELIGHNVKVGCNTYVSPQVTIGNDVCIGHNVVIEGKVTIGAHSIIEHGAIIGACGFGHYFDENKNPWRVIHLGGVTIGEWVYIGANSTIARGTLSDTIIGNYVKIDTLCHIAHNARVGNGVLFTGGAGVAGSTIIEDNVWLGPRCCVNNGVKIGKNSFIAIASVVIGDMPAGKYIKGNPAKAVADVRPNSYTI